MYLKFGVILGLMWTLSMPMVPEIVELCEAIVETQREEIAQMQSILERYASE